MSSVQPGDLLIHPSTPVPMRDGVHLATLILRPSEPGRFPVLLARTPYGKINEMPNFLLLAARRGYVVAVQDVRGTGESEGSFIPFTSEQQDSYDTLQWLIEQEYVLPRIGMFGGSYVGFTQFAAARSGHPALLTITPRVCTSNPRDLWDNGLGAFPLQTWLEWTTSAVLSQAALRAPGQISGQFALFSRTLMEGLSTGESYQTLPLADYPFLGEERLSAFPRQVLESFANPKNFESFPSEGFPSIPTLYIGGWYDPFTTRFLANCTIDSNSSPHHLLIGPWDHFSDSQVVGSLDFGFEASPWSLNLPELLLGWFDFVIRGDQNQFAGKQPMRLFNMGINHFEIFSSWPPEPGSEMRLFLHSSGQANTSENGTLSGAFPGQEPPDTFIYDPTNPVPSNGGALLRSPLVPTGPRDQSWIESRPDVLVYTTQPLDRPLTLAGPIMLTLYVSSSAPDTDFSAKLVDVHPNGCSFNLLQGHLRMRFREPQKGILPVLPGEVYCIQTAMGATFHTFLPGHRLGLNVSSSDFPYTLRNLNTMETLLDQVSWTKAENSIHHESEAPSFLLFSVFQPETVI